MAYRTNIPKLLRKFDWSVTSDEFTEIEDPDPDNHEKRQRELINEIEEARVELQAQPEKRRFGIFKRGKKRGDKKNWETYDETSKSGGAEYGGDPNGPLFDIEAIRREAIELAAEGIEIKQLESTMPPMKIDSAAMTPPLRFAEAPSSKPGTPITGTSGWGSKPTTPKVHGTESFQGEIQPSPLRRDESSSMTASSRNSYFNDDDTRDLSDKLSFAQDDVQMSFETVRDRAPAIPPKSTAGSSRSASPQSRSGFGKDSPGYGSTPSLVAPRPIGASSNISLPPNSSHHSSRSPSPSRTYQIPRRETNGHAPGPSKTQPKMSNTDFNSNPWADDDDMGHEKEVSMTFE